MLNPDSPLPLYQQLAALLKKKIDAQEYAAGEAILSEPKLALLHKIGRPTVREAIRLLVREGYLEKRHGAGTFVRERPAAIGLFSLAGSSDAFRKKGITIDRKIIEKTRRIIVENDPENPFDLREAWFFSRLSSHEGETVLFEETWLAAALFADLGRFDFSKTSLSDIVKDEYYLTPAACSQTFDVVATKHRVRPYFPGRAVPLLQVTRTLFFRDRICGLFSRLFCRTDRFRFSQDLNQTG